MSTLLNVSRSELKYLLNPSYSEKLARSISLYLPSYPYPDGSLLARISSLYLDTSSLDLYKTRAERPSDNILMRLRWYGELGSELVYIERKKCEDSIKKKKRFGLSPQDVTFFLNGDNCCASVAIHNPKLEDQLMANDLCAKFQQFIVTSRLQTTLHVSYLRRAFQDIRNAKVRLTIDTEIKVRLVEDLSQLDNPSKQTYSFPFAILEVKLEEEGPSWIASIINNPEIRIAPHFSKYVHGVSNLVFPHREIP
jgi:SPX domain protein involved in polyphosphate accumulation